MGLLDGKVAVITGAARGQGRAHAVTCAREGADVVLVDVPGHLSSVDYPLGTASDLKETASQVEGLNRRALVFEGDTRSQATMDEAVRAGVAEFGKIDILIPNAGIWTHAPFWELSEEQWDEMIGVNLTAVWKAAKAVAPHMIERQAGSIVLTSSMNGLRPGAHFAHYTSAKHGVIGLMKTIALELAPHGVRCNAISPGAILTGMMDHQSAWDFTAGHAGATHEEFVSLGYHYPALKGTTFLPPQVIADAALYLNSALASAVTGITLPVDAGHLLLDGFNQSPVIPG